MKYLKKNPKKKIPVGLWIGIAVLVLAVVLLLAMCGGEDNQLPDPSVDTADTAPSDAPNDASEPADPDDDAQKDTVPGETGGETPTDPADVGTEAPDAGSTEAPDVGPTEAQTEPIQIQTPYRTLHYPGDWQKVLKVEKIEGEPYTLIFYANLESGKVQELFTIKLGGDIADAVGTMKSDDGKDVFVHISSVDFKPDDSWTNSEINIVYYMMEALNDVLQDMDLQPINQMPTEPVGTVPELDSEDMALDTPYGELHYPSRWSEYLDIQIDEDDVYSVAFYCAMEDHEKLHLFTIHFGGTEGASLTTVTDSNGNTVEARITISELVLDDSWTDSEQSIAYAMQEDMNYLLSKLS